MKCARFVLMAVLLMGSAAFAYADGVPVDPQMDSDPICGVNTVCANPVGPNQGFMFTTVGPNADRSLTDSVILTPVPEPGTLTLLGIGLGALAAKRRFRSQRNSKS